MLLRFSTFVFVFVLVYDSAVGQRVLTEAVIHAHNDYKNARPFSNAYARGAGSIEADIFLQDGELYVAHTATEIDATHTLDALYLQPLQQIIQAHPAQKRPLQLLVDIKTEAGPTLRALIAKLNTYPATVFTQNAEWKIVISGNEVPPTEWHTLPTYIYFDGRPTITYTPEQLTHVALISDNVQHYVKWPASHTLSKAEEKKVMKVIKSVHKQGKPIRFWATPDQPDAWKTLWALGVDLIGTDDVDGLAAFIKN